MSEKLFISIKEAANALAVSTKLLYKLVSEGKIQAVRIGRAVRLSRKSLDEFLGGAAVEAGPKPTPAAPPEAVKPAPARQARKRGGKKTYRHVPRNPPR
jgi:excisionase family DNA binding protein